MISKDLISDQVLEEAIAIVLVAQVGFQIGSAIVGRHHRIGLSGDSFGELPWCPTNRLIRHIQVHSVIVGELALLNIMVDKMLHSEADSLVIIIGLVVRAGDVLLQLLHSLILNHLVVRDSCHSCWIIVLNSFDRHDIVND